MLLPISFQISSKGEPFFLDLAEGLAVLADVEAGALASSAVCTGVWILTAGRALEGENSLVTLLITD